MPIRILATEATRADSSLAPELIEGLSAEHLIADKGYDSDSIVVLAQRQGMRAVISPRRNRKVLRDYIDISTGSDISSRTHFSTSSSGGASLRATPNGCRRSLRLRKFDASCFGCVSRNDTI